METNDYSTAPQRSFRPTFLTVLCVLTFIGSGWSLFSGVRQYFNADQQAAIASEAMEKAKEKMENAPPSFFTHIFDSISQATSPESIRKSSILVIIQRLFTLFGAILMWNLRKIGFYSYVTGIVISIIGPLFVIGTGMLGVMAAGSAAFIGLIFVLMYGANLKYMTE